MQNRTNTKHESLTDSLFHKKSEFFSDSFFNQKFSAHNHNKRDLRASGLSLLPLALRPLLSLQKNLSKFFQTFLHSKLSLVALILPIFISIFIFQTVNVSAKSVTLTIPSTPLTLNVEPNSGTVFKKSSPGTISVSTDSSYGYSLSIQSKTSNDLLNGSNKIASIVSALSESDYKNNGDSNTWAYLPSKLGGSINTDFQPGPTTEPTTLDRIENSSDGTNYNLTLATKIDNTLPAGNYSNTFVLSATSNDPPYDDIIQNWADCDTLESEQSINLLDIRDNKIYSVAKLRDGQCWMTENLAIGKEGEEMQLSSDTSDTANDFTLPASEDKPNPNNEYDKSFIHLDSQYGGYYTWFTATAGEGAQSISTDGQSVEHSICPKGWRLPTKQDFIDLDKAFGGTGENIQSSSTNVGGNKTLLQIYQDQPASFLMGGYYSSGNPDNVGSGAAYWSSIASEANSAYRLSFTSSVVFPQAWLGKNYLASVRCVARPNNPKRVGTMQTVDEWGDNVEQGKTVISEDIRDNKQYTVARLADGRLWMTKNLAIGKEGEEMKLTSDTSDTANGFTILASSDTPNSNDTYDSREIHLDSTYGGYYTWYTTTAGEGTTNVLSYNQNVQHSICPKGWRLPTMQDFFNLDVAFGGTGQNNQSSIIQSNKYMDLPNNLKMGGFFSSGSQNNVDINAYYWSSNTYDTNSAFYLDFNSSYVSPQGIRNKATSMSVRCISRTDDPKEVGSLQTVGEWGDSVEEGETVISKDVRDSKQYTVARLADGRLWMTKNLEIENYNLTSVDSDVLKSFALPSSTDRPNSNQLYDSKELHIDANYGGYYTWYTATAGEGTYDKSSDDVSHSICPKDWRLPTNIEYKTLTDIYNIGNSPEGSAKLQSNPLNFNLGGYYDRSLFRDMGWSGHYWSSTARPSVNVNAYELYFSKSTMTPQNYNTKSEGISVRCVSRE